MTSKVKGQGRKIMWSSWQSPRNTKSGRKVAHPTDNNMHQVRGQKVKRSRSPDRLMLKPKVCRLRASNLVGGWSILPWPAIKACEVGLLHVGGGIGYCVGRARWRPHNLFVSKISVLTQSWWKHFVQYFILYSSKEREQQTSVIPINLWWESILTVAGRRK